MRDFFCGHGAQQGHVAGANLAIAQFQPHNICQTGAIQIELFAAVIDRACT